MDRDTPSSRAASRPQLRTYSKRTTPRDDSEPPAKKQKTTSNVAKPTAAADGMPQVPASSDKPEPSPARTLKSKPQPELPVAQRPREPAKKGTIMSYFKVTSPSSGSATPCEVSSEAVHPPSTPPSSPPALSHESRKRRRRLTTKPSYQTTPELESERDASEPAAEAELEKSPKALAFSEVGAQKLNQQDKSEESRSEAGKRGTTRKTAKPKKTATVQTTIVLSLNETGFVECEECNMLYNSLHEKDVKLHARRHAALLRKAKLGEYERED
ncbi:hypothetical protein PG993_000847 [Apiospora rasikravindrae]|uniref:N-acetyltransferase ESCO zinc-finger domain-containing protein n=1 Tax=Apiospora rasikravindrae TaxID=990691 RepID=A0ABR1U9Q7_9PEZI